jgi:anti-anti-sigma factor
MSKGRIQYAEHDGHYTIQMLGQVRYTMSQGLDKLIESIAADPHACSIAVDLTGADYLDSTNLGLLARIATISLDRFKHPAPLFSCKKEINEILYCMGFDQVFHITGNPQVAGDLPCDITEETTSASALLLKAHRNLCHMNDRNAAAFHDIVELLEAEIE